MTQYQTTENSVISLEIGIEIWTFGFSHFIFHWHTQFWLKKFLHEMNVFQVQFEFSSKIRRKNTLLKLQNVAYCWIVEDEFFLLFFVFHSTKKKHNANGLNTQWVKTNARNTQRYRFVSDNVLTSTVLCHCSTLNINRLCFQSTMEPISSR